jgi:DNA-binding NtrC family response regulator
MSRILVCDDEELVRWSLAEGLRSRGHDVVEGADGEACLEALQREQPELVIMDVRMPRLDGLGALRRLREMGFETPVIMLTAMSDIETAVEATRLGAERYLTKPFELADVYQAVREVLDRQRLAADVDGAELPCGPNGLIGSSPAMRSIFDALEKLRAVPLPTVLLYGESGTGKDLIARAIHQIGRRSEGPYVEIDCTAIPETLMESTLFGHERGAFTDARTQHRGLFEVAQGGVVFLDEIGELPLTMQAKLLRALENRRFKRVGGNVDLPLDAAVVAATNRDLRAEVARGRFREDLYYRLAVVQLSLPPLRARGEDIRLLADAFIQSGNRTFEKQVRRIAPAAMEKLLRYRWPGNVRELRNVIESAMVFHQGDTLQITDLPASIRYATTEWTAGCPFLLPEEGIELDAVERGLVQQALERTQHNYAAAARLLGLSRYALRNRVKKFGLGRPEGDEAEGDEGNDR